jgi:hypothetical protein
VIAEGSLRRQFRPSAVQDPAMVRFGQTHQRPWARESLSTSRKAVPNLNQRIRVATDRDGGISALSTP